MRFKMMMVKTVAACDLLVPGIGELVGGSQREERYDVLEKIMDEKGMAKRRITMVHGSTSFLVDVNMLDLV